jgi:ABC-type glycerol-3-phosphate transport system substrate-binding protein
VNRRQILRTAALAFASGMAHLGCAAPQPSAGPTPQPTTAAKAATAAPGQGTITPVIWTVTYQPFVDGLKALGARFGEANPNVTFDIQPFAFAQFWDKFTAAVASSAGPDIGHLYTAQMYRLVSEGVLLELDQKDFPLEKMSPMVKQSLLDGKLWAAPQGVRSFAYIYNPDLYAKAGVTQPPATWQDEITVAEKLTQVDKDGKMVVVGEGIYPKWEGFSGFHIRSVQAGGSWISQDLRKMTWDDPGAIEAFRFTTSKMTQHKIFLDGFHSDWATAWADGVVGGFIANSGVVGALRGMKTPFKVAPFPAGPKSAVTLGNYWPLGLTKQLTDQKLEVARNFVKYTCTPDGNRTWARITGDIPTLLEVAAEPEFVNADYGEFVRQASNTVFVFDPDSLVTRVGWEQAWDKVVLQGADPKTALLEGMPNAQQVLDQFWRKMDARK